MFSCPSRPAPVLRMISTMSGWLITGGSPRPSVYFRLGVRNEKLGAVYPLQHPRFRVDEQALSIGAVVLCDSARNFLMRLT
ncbi:hypothetical protein MESS4_40010 [Mesorhizobium sp. STM 4661]|nr:hypothetical protein MESS4_40010 [Mesorhizobium sp. STM 4661]